MQLMVYAVIVLVVLMFLGVPLPLCFGGALSLFVIIGGLNIKSLLVWGFSQMISFTLLAGPMFILSGAFINNTKIADRLLDLVESFTNKIKGGIGIISIVTCGFLGAISGSAFTGLAAVGPSLFPKMVKQGYPRGYAAALISSSTILGVLIPPSLTMITYGWITGESVLACFLSTVIPAFLLMFLLSVINIRDARRFDTGTIVEADAPKKSKAKLWVSSIPALMMPVIILGGIYGGIFTASEAAAVAVCVCIIIGLLVYRNLNFKSFMGALRESSSSIGSIMLMIFFCLLLSQCFVLLKLPEQLIAMFMSFTDSKIVVLLCINVFLLFLGMIVNDGTAVVLCAPILLPLCQAYGIGGVQLAALMVMNLSIGGLTPPYASILYLGMRVCDVSFEEIMPPVIKLIVFAYLPVTIATTYIPELSLFLPRLFGLA
ncbi:TRAP transporter large permease subunit [Oscillibacter sp. MCC667]|nr:TRAP transporter large permease subunit [Oscillibacter sp. MCC667]